MNTSLWFQHISVLECVMLVSPLITLREV